MKLRDMVLGAFITAATVGCSREPHRPDADELKRVFGIPDAVVLSLDDAKTEAALNSLNEIYGRGQEVKHLVWSRTYQNRRELPNDIWLAAFNKGGLTGSELFEKMKLRKVELPEGMVISTLVLGFGDGGASVGTVIESPDSQYEFLLVLSEDYENPERPVGGGWDIEQIGVDVAPDLLKVLKK